MTDSTTTTASSPRTVASLSAMRLSYGLLLRQLITRGRIVALLLVGVVIAVVAAAVGSADDLSDPREAGVRVISDLGFTALVPIVALVFASAALGDAREDGTLVYLWLRPMHRWPVVVGAWLAALTVSLPLTVVPLGAAAMLVDGGGSLVSGAIIATVVGVVAYTALFVLVGLLLKNAIVWGLGYILIWEGIVAAFGSFAAKLAIRGYTRSIITARTGVDLDLGDLPLAVGVAVPLLAAAVALVLASVRLRSMDVA
jgi:ABC-2 type transport system permease protein